MDFELADYALGDDMALTTAELRTGLEEAERELRDVQGILMDASTREQKLIARRDAYRVLLGEEYSESGKREASMESQPETAQLSSTSDDGNGTNKTAVIRSIIRAAGSRGITAKQIWRGVEAQGTKMPRNYLYAVLTRLVNNGSLHRHGEIYSEKGR